MKTMLLALAALLAPWSALANTQYAKVAIVGQQGGYYDYTSPTQAMSDLATWCGTPSATNPCLINIMPGVYDLGAEYLPMTSYVDVAGSGQDVTTLRGSNGFGGIVRFYLTEKAELRSLTLESAAVVADAYGITSLNASALVRDVAVRLSGATDRIWGVHLGGSQTVRDVVLDRVSVTATGPTRYATCPVYVGGTVNLTIQDSALTTSEGPGTPTVRVALWVRAGATTTAVDTLFRGGVKNEATTKLIGADVSVDPSAGTGVYVQSGTVHVERSRVAGWYTVYTEGAANAFIGASKLEGGLPYRWGTGVLKCAHAYTGDYVELGGSCQIP